MRVNRVIGWANPAPASGDLLFTGTDFGMDWTNKAIVNARIPDAEKQAIFGGTAARALARAGMRLQAAAE